MLNLTARSGSWYEALTSSYWFVPAVMTASAAVLSIVMTELDQRISIQWLADGHWSYTGSPDGARTLLGAIASSMIGVAGVVFSINIVALTLASGQFGSRLLRNFMRDKGNQITLGTFLAGFLYCLLILRAVHSGDDSGLEPFVPQLSILVAVLMAVAGLAVLIYFIHHSAESIQAPNVIAAVSRDLHAEIQRLFPERPGPADAEAPAEARGHSLSLPPDFVRDSVAVEAGRGGHLQRVEIEELLEEATAADLLVRLERRPGQYVQWDDVVIRAWPRSRVDEELSARIRATFTVGSQRSFTQDARFAVEQLVEVACRALSPGINDPFTAMQCVDRLGEALSLLGTRALPPPFDRDEDGNVRVVRYGERFEEYLDLAFNQIRQYSERSLDVMLRMLEAMARVARHLQRPEDLKALEEHARLVYAQAVAACGDAQRDRRDVEARFAVLAEALQR